MPARDARAELLAELHSLVDIVRRDLRLRERSAGASMPALRAAAAIAASPGISPSALADELHLDRSTVSNLLRDMQAQGLVQRKRLTEDRRHVSLDLTARGHSLTLTAGRPGTGALSRAVRNLDARDIVKLLQSLEPLLLALRGDGSRSRRLR
ncbi:MAG: MarR family transcriptional regulator [Gammaproteobacteria bacterium]|nr:MarR family transcriptional regulator [Gammaproteobacteria bacterium]